VTADSSFRITSGDLYGQRYFFGRIERLAFEAVMLPDRSWWNPKIPANMRGYVLQHEQIHFALMELAAQQLTIDIQKWASEVLVIEPTRQEVGAELARQIKDRINAAMESNLKRQAANSMRIHPSSITPGGSSGGPGPWRMNSSGLILIAFSAS
jgi:hypothetical protein